MDRRRTFSDNRDEEPEWFSSGPTSQHDTIELRGFDDIPEDKATGPGGSAKSKKQTPAQKKRNKKAAMDKEEKAAATAAAAAAVAAAAAAAASTAPSSQNKKEVDSKSKLSFGNFYKLNI